MARAIGQTSRNPKYALTAEKYAAMLKAYIQFPAAAISKLTEMANVGRPMIKRALEQGWPELGLPPLTVAASQLIDPVEVHKLMAQMQEQSAQIVENIFGKEPEKSISTPEVVQEVNKVKAEGEMAARVATSIAVKSARAIEKLADHFGQLIEDGAFELPTALRPEHVFMLARATDVAVGAIQKSLAAEKAALGKPDTVIGTQITTLLIGATPEELRQVALTGNLPPRLLGIDTVALPSVSDPIDVLAVAKALQADPELDSKKASASGSKA